MPKLLCESQVYRPGTRRSIRRENPYHNKKNVANKEDIRENVSPQKRIDSTLCLLCKSKINVEARRFLQDIQYHYTLCLFREGRFREIVPPMNDDENKRQYICLRQGCSMREMRYREYCIHEGIAHSATKKLMASDSRPGLKNILSGLFPKKENTAEEKAQRDIAKMTVEPNKNVPKINIRKDSPKSCVRSDFSRMEEEEVDDPSNIINDPDAFDKESEAVNLDAEEDEIVKVEEKVKKELKEVRVKKPKFYPCGLCSRCLSKNCGSCEPCKNRRKQKRVCNSRTCGNRVTKAEKNAMKVWQRRAREGKGVKKSSPIIIQLLQLVNNYVFNRTRCHRCEGCKMKKAKKFCMACSECIDFKFAPDVKKHRVRTCHRCLGSPNTP